MKDTFEQNKNKVLPEAHVGEAGNGAPDLAALRFLHPDLNGNKKYDSS